MPIAGCTRKIFIGVPFFSVFLKANYTLSIIRYIFHHYLLFCFYFLLSPACLQWVEAKNFGQLQVCRYHKTYHFGMYDATYLRHTCRFCLFSAAQPAEKILLLRRHFTFPAFFSASIILESWRMSVPEKNFSSGNPSLIFI